MRNEWISLLVLIGLVAIVPQVRAAELPEVFIAIEPDPVPVPPDGSRWR